MTSLHYIDFLNQIYSKNLRDMIQGTPGYVIEYTPFPPRRGTAPLGNCPGCGAPMEAERMRCRYCRRDY